MRSASSLVRPDEAEIVTFCSWSVAKSVADTFRILLASMSNLTSIFIIPRGAGGMPSGWILRDQHAHHSAQRFDAQRKRNHIEQKDVLYVPAQHAALNRSAHRHHFVGV